MAPSWAHCPLRIHGAFRAPNITHSILLNLFLCVFICVSICIYTLKHTCISLCKLNLRLPKPICVIRWLNCTGSSGAAGVTGSLVQEADACVGACMCNCVTHERTNWLWKANKYRQTGRQADEHTDTLWYLQTPSYKLDNKSCLIHNSYKNLENVYK